MKILVTGGAGFIGSHLTDTLLEDGHDLLVIDNLATGARENVPEAAELVEGSIADTDLVDETFERFLPDAVIHCAASYKDPDGWIEDVRTNAQGTAAVVRAAQAHGANRLIYFQTALCYGNAPLEQPVTLDHPLRPESSYAISKTAGEQYIEMSGLDFVSFRLANVYGPRNVSGPIPTFYKRLNEGKPCFAVDTRRDFIFVRDLVEVALKAIDGEGSGIYHVSSGKDFSIKELYDCVADKMEKDEEVEERPAAPDDAPTILLDPSVTEADFSWRVETPLERGIAATIASYGEHGVEETYTHLRMKT